MRPGALGAGMRYDMMPHVAAHDSDVATPADLIACNRADPARRIAFGRDLPEGFAPPTADFTPEDHATPTAEMTGAMPGTMEAAFAAHGGVEAPVSMANLPSPFSATAGHPAITVPIGRRDDGEPTGVTPIGRKGPDAQLPSFAQAFARATLARMRADLP